MVICHRLRSIQMLGGLTHRERTCLRQVHQDRTRRTGELGSLAVAAVEQQVGRTEQFGEPCRVGVLGRAHSFRVAVARSIVNPDGFGSLAAFSSGFPGAGRPGT